MKTKKNNWVKNPSRPQMILCTLVYFVSVVLLVLSMTDLFTENIFQGKYLLLYFVIIGATLATLKLHSNYWNLKTVVADGVKRFN